jgi:V/A-type H+-transporting ATPase subunit I
MPFSDTLQPARMSRVAVVAPKPLLRDALVAVADAGTVELVVPAGAADGPEAEALRRLDRSRPGAASDAPRIARDRPDPSDLEHGGRRDLLAGEVELVRRSATAITHGSFATLVGWTPTESLPELDERLQAIGAAAVELPIPPFAEPPTLVVETTTRRPFRPLVSTYGVAPYANVDVTLFAGIAFVVMFAIMFGDTGHGLLLALVGLMIRRARRGRLAPLQPMWPLFVLSGLGAALVGLLYGDALGPTGLVPRLWIDPVEDPLPLFAVAVTVGIALLTVSHLFGIVNRYRESGLRAAILSPSALAGLLVLGGATTVALGWLTSSDPAVWAGAACVVIGIVLLAVGFLVAALADGGVGTAVTQALVELFDAVVRIGANVLSFARLAAFGVLHSALGLAVFAAAGALWGGFVGSVLAIVVFVLGNALTFSIELLVTTVQALRLEFYELFSRVFTSQGHAFTPWHVPVVSGSEEP